MSTGAEVVIVKQKRMMRRFTESGAVSPQTAKTLEELDCRDSFLFRRMAAAGVFRRTEEGKYYLDERAAAEFRGRQKTRILIAMLIALLLVVLIVMLQR